ncbi:MAG: hypothetical protein JWP66_219 [Naasia sp.]|nr:hypothetical protein [Naasia sp.]
MTSPLGRRLTLLAFAVGALAWLVLGIWVGTSMLARLVAAPVSASQPAASPRVAPPNTSASTPPRPHPGASGTPVARPITLNPGAGPVDLVAAAGQFWCAFAIDPTPAR